jgi:hypothetical protein
MTVARGRGRLATAAVTAAIIALGAAAGFAQRIWYGGYGYTPPRFPTKQSFTGDFNFCRAMFESNRRDILVWMSVFYG